MKKKEHLNSYIKRIGGYLYFRRYYNYKYSMHDLISYTRLQERVLKEEDFSEWDVTLKDGLEDL